MHWCLYARILLRDRLIDYLSQSHVHASRSCSTAPGGRGRGKRLPRQRRGRPARCPRRWPRRRRHARCGPHQVRFDPPKLIAGLRHGLVGPLHCPFASPIVAHDVKVGVLCASHYVIRETACKGARVAAEGLEHRHVVGCRVVERLGRQREHRAIIHAGQRSVVSPNTPQSGLADPRVRHVLFQAGPDQYGAEIMFPVGQVSRRELPSQVPPKHPPTTLSPRIETV
mmetsp:Transcript_111073/g.310709  ORF Transcript_111073/g.310709 Transcript_111073/m.310709 type:complete len:226 (-) Transcript_111073:574-1251(-)